MIRRSASRSSATHAKEGQGLDALLTRLVRLKADQSA
jgi:hypothetical protein